MRTTLLSGGTGGAKLAQGLYQVADGGQLSIIANTGDDIEAYGLRICPDPDLITYWLAGLIDSDRGWGISGETFHIHSQLEDIGARDSWFKLGDRDMATCLLRTQLLGEGLRLTEVSDRIAAAYDVRASVLPMSDDTVTTYVKYEGSWRHFQEYLIRRQSDPEVESVEYRGAERARITEEVRDAIQVADVIVIGPSNPIGSIGPIISVPGIRSALEATGAPVISVSPLVGGRSLKGPTEKFMRAAGLSLDNGGVAQAYEGLLDGLVSDAAEPSPHDLTLHCTDTRMDTVEDGARLAEEVLSFAQKLRSSRILRKTAP